MTSSERIMTALLLTAALAAGCSRDSSDAEVNAPASTQPVAEQREISVAQEPAAAVAQTVSVASDEPEQAAEAEPSPIALTLCASGLPDEDEMFKCDPVFADVNKDGHLDVAAIARLGDGPRVWLGDGKGNWTESSNGLKYTESRQSCGGGVRLHDVNLDTHLDLVVGDHCSGVFVFLGDGAGNWTMVTDALYPEDIIPVGQHEAKYKGVESVAVGDVNGDGFADILAGSADESGVRLYLGDGTGQNWERRDGVLPQTGWSVRVELHDMNGDGWLDAVCSYSEGLRVFLNDEGKTWKSGSANMPTPMMGGIFHGLAVGDINGDGRPDISVANWVDGPEVYLQQENGSWTKMPDVFPGMVGGAVGLDLGDLNGDGHLDIVVSGRKDLDVGFVRGVYALLGDGTGQNWKYLENCGLPATGLAAMSGVGLADINADGTLDVAACSGLIVETSPTGAQEPALPYNILIWCNTATAQAAVTTEEQ